MSSGVISNLYTVQQGDTLSAIAQQFYGDASLWPQIYNANKQVIGNNPNLITPGMQLYLLPNPYTTQVYLATQSCTVTITSLAVYDSPTTKSTVIASYPLGTVLNFTEVIYGEPVDANLNWGHSTDGHYFWMGGTNWVSGYSNDNLYAIQQGDTLSAIAQRFYGNESLWPQIYTANKQVVGNNPNLIIPGMQLFLVANPQYGQVYLATQSCTVTVTSLDAHESPTTKSTVLASYPLGTVLNFTEIISGEPADTVSTWGRSTQGQYFWLGGTNRQQPIV